MKQNLMLVISFTLIFLSSCKKQESAPESEQQDTTTQSSNSPSLPAASESHKNFSDVIGWPEGKTPIAPQGFEVTAFAKNIKSPRWIYVHSNGDVFVALSNTESKGIKKVKDAVSGKSKSQHTGESANVILLYQKGKAATTFLSDLNQPIGMLIHDSYFFVANVDGLYRYPYKEGATTITSQGEKLIELPEGKYNNHWTRNIIKNKSGTKVFLSVGSGSNVAEHGMENEVRRANILEVNFDGTGERVFASGLRNPVGMAINPETGELWTAVNERDDLGDNLVPDYITSVKDGGFYGWPYSYFGQHVDTRIKEEERRPDLVAKAIVPDVNLGSHTASLGLAFYDKDKFPSRYKNGAFVGQHGSWNHSGLVGYKVVFVPFQNGKPGQPEDFLTGFIADESKSKVYGRPVGVAVTNEGDLLVADDASDVIWKVSAKKP